MDISILIVDDDKLVVEKLVEGVNWKQLGIGIVLTAYNIRQAKEILEEARVDILLSDIEMPQGSGLELLEWVRNKEIPVECIFLSSYAYFAYAQKAINLKSREYMLKPVFNRELEEALGSIVEILQKKREEQGEGEDKKSAFWERYLLQENYSRSLLEKGYKEGICSPEGKYFLEIIRIFPDSDTKKKKNLVLYHFIIQNVAAEFMEDRHQKLMAVLRESDYEWVLVAEEKGSQEQRKMDSCQLKECLEKALHMRVCFYMGVSSSVEELGKSRRNLEQMEQEAVPGNNGMLFEEEWDKKDIAYVSPPWEIWEKEMSASDMIADTQEKILHFLEELWNSNQVTISTLEQFRREMMQMIYRYLNKQDVLITRIFDGREFDEHYESAVATLPDMEIFIRYIFEKLAGFQHQDNRQESVVEQIKHYINDHLKEDLSRKTLAGSVYLSEDYVSKIFMNVTGISIPSYVASCRMQKAQEYLKYSTFSVSKVALEVGYSNFSYFSKTFRDYTGCTPNEYRNRVTKKQG